MAETGQRRSIAALRAWVRDRPRSAAAIGFATTTATVTHFAWIPDARFSGAVPLVTISAGLAHAAAGALMGARLLDRSRTETPSQACVLGGCTSLAGLALFAPLFAMWLESENARPDLFSYLALVPLVGFFSFLAAGWALLIVSIGVGWGLFRLAAPHKG